MLYIGRMIPPSSARFLDRREAHLRRRRDEAAVALERIERELADIDAARQALQAPRNGRAVKVPQILKGIQLTMKDRVLIAVRSKQKTGMSRWEILDKLAKQGVATSVAAVSTYLDRLQRDGSVRHDEVGKWFQK